jgi:hypothetical protein
MALVGTLRAIALGLLIGSAKTYYDTQSNELTQVSANEAVFTAKWACSFRFNRSRNRASSGSNLWFFTGDQVAASTEWRRLTFARKRCNGDLPSQRIVQGLLRNPAASEAW